MLVRFYQKNRHSFIEAYSQESPSSAAMELAPMELIERRIYLIRGRKVMLDADSADLYEVDTKNVNKAVSRNLDRFPEDFMFQLSKEEFENLRF